MSISYPLSLPTSVKPNRTTWGLDSVVGNLESIYTKQQHVQEQDGERWAIELDFPVMEIAEAGAFRSFMAKLRGVYGTFLYGDVTRASAQGNPAGTGRVNGASQTGNNLVTDGWTASVTDLFKEGDWIQLGSGSSSKLHMVVEDVDSDGSGNATLKIVPELRDSPADDAVITYSDCKGVFRLQSNSVAVFSTSGPDHTRIRIKAVEAL